MSSFLSGLKADSERCVLAPDGRVYKIRRIKAADMAEHAVAELVGAMEVEAELKKLQAEQKAEAAAWKAEHVTPEDLEEFKAKEEDRAAHAMRMAHMATIRALGRTPKVAGMQLARIDAYCCAGVVAGGTFKGEPPEPNYPDANPTQYVGLVNEADCELVEVRFCQGKAEENLEGGVGWIGRVDEETRGWLCGAVSRLSGSPSVAPFRR